MDDDCARVNYMSLFHKLIATVTGRFWHSGIVKEAPTKPGRLLWNTEARTFHFTHTMKQL